MLRDDQDARLSIMLDNLETALNDLPSRSHEFVTQTIDRYVKYGKRTLLSPKQWDWLESLHAEYCPAAPDLPKLDDPEPEERPQPAQQLKKKTPSKDPYDDEIPF